MSSSRRSPTIRRVRARLRGRAGPYWVLSIGLALSTSVVVGRLSAEAIDARARWGESRPTLVARVNLPAGHRLTAGDTELVDWPVAVVPDGALAGGAEGRVLRGPVRRGEALVDARLDTGQGSATAALVPAGQRAVAVPQGPARPPLDVGDRVDLVASFELDQATTDSPTVTVARGAPVLAVDDVAVTVAVPTDDVERVAYALTAGDVTLALAGPR